MTINHFKAFAVFSIPLLSSMSQAGSENNVMKNFRYTSCSKLECVEIQAEKAWISVAGGGFTTDVAATLKIFTIDGQLKSSKKEVTATFNPKLDIITFEKENGEFLLYTLSEASRIK